MKKFVAVFKFYFLQGFMAKGFLITMLVLMGAIVAVCAISASSTEKTSEFAVIVEAPAYKMDTKALEKQMEHSKFQLFSKENASDIKKRVENGKYDGLYTIKEGPVVEETYKNFSNSEALALIVGMVQGQHIQEVAIQDKIDPAVVAKLLAPIQVKNVAIQDSMKTFGLVYVLVFLMYMFIIIFGQSIGTSIAAEKSSRVMEIMLSKVKPLTLLYGKMAAVLSLALSQFVAMGLAFFGCYLAGLVDTDKLSLFGDALIDLDSITPFILVMFIVYFFMGFILYGILYAAAGAMISRVEDLGTVVMPIVFMVIAAFLISMQATVNPTSTLLEISSYFPFFSPIVTFARIAAGVASGVEIIGSLLIMVATFIAINYFIRRIYVNGVMNYKEKFNWKDFIHFAKRS